MIKKTRKIDFRMTNKEFKLFKRYVKKHADNKSEFIREAIRHYICLLKEAEKF